VWLCVACAVELTETADDAKGDGGRG
jgi:hypothetical protein